MEPCRSTDLEVGIVYERSNSDVLLQKFVRFQCFSENWAVLLVHALNSIRQRFCYVFRRSLAPSVNSSSVEKAAHMGVLKPTDFLLFDLDELVDMYEFSLESATTILDALQDENEDAQAPAPTQCAFDC